MTKQIISAPGITTKPKHYSSLFTHAERSLLFLCMSYTPSPPPPKEKKSCSMIHGEKTGTQTSHSMFKVIHSLAPAYLGGLMIIRNSPCLNLRSDNGMLLYDPTARLKRTLGGRPFTAATPEMWNSLPSLLGIRTI